MYYSGTVGCSACGREVTDRLSAPSDSQQVMERFISKQLTAVAQGWVQKNGIQGGCDLRDDEFRIFFEIVGKFNRNIFSGISKDGLAKVKDFLGE